MDTPIQELRESGKKGLLKRNDMNLFKSKPIIKEQPPWTVTVYSSIHNKGTDKEFDDGWVEFINGKTVRRKEMAEFRGEEPYNKAGYKPPDLIDIWNWLLKITPGTKGFSYKNWRVMREHDCFVYVLPNVDYKNIIGDYTSRQQDFASFLNMLDNIQEEKEEITDLGTL